MIRLIINPVSGPRRRGRAVERVAVARQVLDATGIPYKIDLTERANHAFELAAEAVRAKAGLVIAWGGDGTLNEVARALAFSETSMGIVPGGSGNGLARELGISFEPADAIRHALAVGDRVIDAGDLDGHLFFNVAGIGMDARVANDVARSKHKRGLWPYFKAGARELFSGGPSEYIVEIGSQTLRGTAITIALANSRQYGFAARIAPTASLNDGRLDLVFVEKRSIVGDVLRVPFLFTGTFHTCAGVLTKQFEEARIRSTGPMLCHVDGEVGHSGEELVVRVRAGALRVRA